MRIKHLVRYGYLMLIALLFNFVLPVYAQTGGRTIKGTVTDQTTGKPQQGVTIAIKSSSQSTTTNERGEFTITVPADATLIFTYVGFARQEVKVGTQTSLNISLAADNKQLDDVVVVGYGTQRARNITGSIVSVDTKKIEDLPVASISEMLRGQVPGLNVVGGSTRPGTMASLNIRQQFNWGKDGGGVIPLIVIDDVVQIDPATNLPTLDQFNRLDLSEVESITVLRDASAAIYGTRASQGAIVVKTKRGKLGVPKISYAGKFETNDEISRGKVMNAREYGIFSNRMARMANRNETTDGSYFFSPSEIASMDSLNYDWLDNAWKRANSMQHSINVSGGSDRASYFAGGSYFTQGANLGSQDFKRYTFRSGMDVKVLNGLKFSSSLSANKTDIEKSFTKINFSDGYSSGGEQNDYSTLLHMPRYIPWEYTINGVQGYVAPVLGPNKPGSASGNNSLSNWNYYALLNNGSFTSNKNFSYTANFSLQYEVPFIKGLSFRGNYAITSNSGNTEQVMMPETLFQPVTGSTAFGSPGKHLYTPALTWNSPIINRSNSRVTYDNTTSNLEQVNFFVNYDRTFGDHMISAVFSGEQSKVTNEDRYQIYDNPISGVYNGTSVSAGTLNTSNTITYKQIGGTQSYLGRTNYTFKNRYLATFLFRSDASSKFAPENYWGFFPSMQLGWIVSDESFFKNNISWVNFLKIRGSIGKTGNDNVKAWKWLQLYTLALDKGMAFGTNGGLFTYGLTPEASPYRDIKWDRTIQRNLGLDFSILRSRLSVNLDGYYNTSTNMLTSMTAAINVPISVGGAFAEQNYGSVKFWGTEISATWSDRIGKDFSYSIGANFGWSNNKVAKYLDLPFNYESQLNASGTKVQGYSLYGPIWGYKTWKGTSTGDGILRTQADVDAYWDYLTALATKAGTSPSYFGVTNKTNLQRGNLAYEDIGGALNANTRTVAGPNGQIVNDGQDLVQLKKTSQSYGINTNMSLGWKSFSLMAQITTSWGGWNSIDRIKQGTASTNASWAQVAYLTDMYDSVDNVNGKYPSMGLYDNAYQNSDFWSLPSFRCVIRSMSIGYTLPKQLLTKAHVSNAKLILSGYNLWDLYNPYPGKYRNMYDAPNVGYPTLRTWSLGVNLGF